LRETNNFFRASNINIMKNLLIIFFSLFCFLNVTAQKTEDFSTKLSLAAIQITLDWVVYDPAYFS